MNEFRVPKHRTPVEVLLPGGAVRQVAVYLSEFALGHAGRERLSDLLNGAGDFFPALDVETESMTFLNRAGIAVARVGVEVEAGGADEYTLPNEHEVEITLVDGAVHAGLVSYVMPPDRSRLIDFLNDAPPFFRLLEKDRISLVNKRHVARVATAKR